MPDKTLPLVFPSVKIEIGGKTYEYFMTNDFYVISKKLNELGYRNLRPTDYRYNPDLPQNVRDKMVELGTCFSLSLTPGRNVLNYFTGKGNPFIVFLKDLAITKDKKIENSYERLKEFHDVLNQEKNKNTVEFSPLMIAAHLGAKEKVKLLLDSGADVNEKTKSGFTALHVACMNGHAEIVKLLIDYGADVDIASDNGYTPVLYALLIKKDDIVKILMDAGARTNIPLGNKVNKEKLTFNQTLSYYISETTMHGLAKISLIYKRTKVYGDRYALSKKTFSKIRNATGENYHPQKNNVLLLAIGMELTVPQTEDLLSSAGYAFDSSSKFDMVVKRFIEKRNFNMGEIEEALFKEAGKTFCKYDD